jgi:hypothetical protein
LPELDLDPGFDLDFDFDFDLAIVRDDTHDRSTAPGLIGRSPER